MKRHRIMPVVQEEQIRQKEDERIVKYLTETDAYRIILAIDGKMLDSVELSGKIENSGFPERAILYL